MAEETIEEPSNILEPSTYTENFLLKDGETPDGPILNSIFQRLFANDQAIAGSFKEVPGVWFCKWYDNELAKGYDRGDFFWVNTENVENFIRDNNQKIRELANKNPFVGKKLPIWKNNDTEVFEMYYNALTGYVDDKVSKSLPPIYYLGELSNNFNLIVSQKNHNKDVPGTVEALSSWKNFAVNTDSDFENMLIVINRNVLSAMDRHLDQYHLGSKVQPTQENIDHLSTAYANEDFTNLSLAFPPNYVENNFLTKGLDCVEAYVRKPYPELRLGNFSVEENWFRKWKSGFLEHGGIIDVRNHLDQTGSLVKISFNWKMLSDGSRYLQRDFLGASSTDPIRIDESYQIPPGDDLIEVLRELDSLFVDGSDYSPNFCNSNYIISLVPIQQQFIAENTLGNVESYSGLGDHNPRDNVLNTSIIRDLCDEKTMYIKWNPNSTTTFYSYYVTGFCLP